MRADKNPVQLLMSKDIKRMGNVILIDIGSCAFQFGDYVLLDEKERKKYKVVKSFAFKDVVVAELEEDK